MESTLAALSDPQRRHIVELLTAREYAVSELVEELPIAQSGVSRHLRILREAGLVSSRADGQRRLYSLEPEPFDELSGWLEGIRAIWASRMDNFERALARRASQTKTNVEGEE